MVPERRRCVCAELAGRASLDLGGSQLEPGLDGQALTPAAVLDLAALALGLEVNAEALSSTED